jgi:hypothetical protein
MRLNVEALKKHGVSVEIGRDGKYIDIHFRNEEPLPQVVNQAVHERVRDGVLADFLLDGLARQISAMQILEAINNTERE